ncbi:MAG: hypothetical protein WAV13_03915 [Thermodesulfovibrionales bacterium]
MENKLNIEGLFESEQELLDVIRKRKICYDSEPYYRTKKGELIQIGYQLGVYGTFPEGHKNATPDDPEFGNVLRDVRRVAEALSNTCDPLHMCEATIIDSNTVTYAHERKMRPDVTVHIPVFDQENYGHPVDDKVRNTLEMAGKMLESAGVKKIRWE